MILKRIAKFTSDIWQVQAFCEGNTRTTAVFMEMYLQDIKKHPLTYFKVNGCFLTLIRQNRIYQDVLQQ